MLDLVSGEGSCSMNAECCHEHPLGSTRLLQTMGCSVSTAKTEPETDAEQQMLAAHNPVNIIWKVEVLEGFFHKGSHRIVT